MSTLAPPRADYDADNAFFIVRDEETEQLQVPPVATNAAGTSSGVAVRPNNAAPLPKKDGGEVASSPSNDAGRRVGGVGGDLSSAETIKKTAFLSKVHTHSAEFTRKLHMSPLPPKTPIDELARVHRALV